MSVVHHTIKLFLYLLIVIGLWGAISVSYSTIMNIEPCPDFLHLPMCYLVSIGYFSMLSAQFVSNIRLKNRLFYSGWILTFLIAGLGVGFELIAGDICPKSAGGLPLCYVSFALCVLIFILYRSTLYRAGRPHP
jgi:hypothetical protein